MLFHIQPSMGLRRTTRASNSNTNFKTHRYHKFWAQTSPLQGSHNEFFVSKEHHRIRYLKLARVIIYSKHVAPEATSTPVNSVVPRHIPGQPSLAWFALGQLHFPKQFSGAVLEFTQSKNNFHQAVCTQPPSADCSIMDETTLVGHSTEENFRHISSITIAVPVRSRDHESALLWKLYCSFSWQ